MSVGFVVFTLFCAGGVIAYARELRRLHRLAASGVRRTATVQKLERIDGGSESIVHYRITYEYRDDQGRRVTDQQDVNSRAFYESLSPGDALAVLCAGRPPTTYPASQVAADQRITRWILVGLVGLWSVGSLAFLFWPTA